MTSFYEICKIEINQVTFVAPHEPSVLLQFRPGSFQSTPDGYFFLFPIPVCNHCYVIIVRCEINDLSRIELELVPGITCP